jgi:hypothetical protein
VIISVRAEPTEMIPPKVWAQLKHLFVSQAALYGVRVQVSEEPSNVMDLEQRYFAWLDEQAARGA